MMWTFLWQTWSLSLFDTKKLMDLLLLSIAKCIPKMNDKINYKVLPNVCEFYVFTSRFFNSHYFLQTIIFCIIRLQNIHITPDITTELSKIKFHGFLIISHSIEEAIKFCDRKFSTAHFLQPENYFTYNNRKTNKLECA